MKSPYRTEQPKVAEANKLVSMSQCFRNENGIGQILPYRIIPRDTSYHSCKVVTIILEWAWITSGGVIPASQYVRTIISTSQHDRRCPETLRNQTDGYVKNIYPIKKEKEPTKSKCIYPGHPMHTGSKSVGNLSQSKSNHHSGLFRWFTLSEERRGGVKQQNVYSSLLCKMSVMATEEAIFHERWWKGTWLTGFSHEKHQR